MLFISPWLGESLAFVTGVLFIGAILLSPLIRENSELRRVGVKRRRLKSIIKDYK